MGIFERLLSLWVALAIIAGALLGWLFPSAFEVVAVTAHHSGASVFDWTV